MDRAERIETADEATTLIDRAHLSGDDVLAAAVLSVSLTSGWPAVTDHYAETYPTHAELIRQRADIDGASGSPTYLRDALNREGSYYLPVPAEIARSNDFAAHSAVTDADAEDEAQPLAPASAAELFAPSGGDMGNYGANPSDSFAAGTRLA